MIPASKSIDGFSRKNGARLAGSSQKNFHFTVTLHHFDSYICCTINPDPELLKIIEMKNKILLYTVITLFLLIGGMGCEKKNYLIIKHKEKFWGLQAHARGMHSILK